MSGKRTYFRVKIFRALWPAFMIQLASVLIAGSVVLFFLPPSQLPDQYQVYNVSVGGKSIPEAKEILYNHFLDMAEKSTIHLVSGGKEVSFSLKEVAFTPDQAFLHQNIDDVFPLNLWGTIAHYQQKNQSLAIKGTYDSSLLAAQAEQAHASLAQAPEDATLNFLDNTITLHNGNVGIEINEKALISQIDKILTEGFSSNTIEIAASDYPDIFVAIPQQVPPEHFKDADTILVRIPYSFNESAGTLGEKLSAQINETFIADKGSFAFVYMLKEIPPELMHDVASPLASAIYQAILPIDTIHDVLRIPSTAIPNYTEPGFEAEISANDPDGLRFTNQTGSPLVMFIQKLTDNKFELILAGSSKVTVADLITETKNIPPATVYVQKNNLRPGQTKVVTDGKEGLSVAVYRTSGNENTLLYEDTYLPENRVIETGRVSNGENK